MPPAAEPSTVKKPIRKKRPSLDDARPDKARTVLIQDGSFDIFAEANSNSWSLLKRLADSQDQGSILQNSVSAEKFIDN
jgi:hypothetical protein